MDFLTEPALIGAFGRLVFWGAMFWLISVVVRVLPKRVGRILTHRLW